MDIENIRDTLWVDLKAASATLRAIPGVGGGPMGLTPDAVKASPEYRAARAACDAAHLRLRAFKRIASALPEDCVRIAYAWRADRGLPPPILTARHYKSVRAASSTLHTVGGA